MDCPKKRRKRGQPFKFSFSSAGLSDVPTSESSQLEGFAVIFFSKRSQ